MRRNGAKYLHDVAVHESPPSASGLGLSYKRLQVSPHIRTYFADAYFSGESSFGLADRITCLGAKSLATKIKQLCFVVTVHQILFKIGLPSRKRHKKTKGAEGTKREEGVEMAHTGSTVSEMKRPLRPR